MPDDYPESVMIALLPITTDWCRIELPHLTLVYVGETSKLKLSIFNELAKDASMLAALSNPIMLKSMNVELFGRDGEEKVDVLLLQPTPELWAMRRAVEKWNGSEYSFKPHVTIGSAGSSNMIELPRYISFNRLVVGWGKEYLTFSLGQQRY